MDRRKWLTLGALTAALALAVGAYLALGRWNAAQEEAKTAPAAVLADLGDLEAVSFTASDGETLSFRREEGSWSYVPDPDFPLAQSRLAAIADALSPLEAQRRFDTPEALEHYGLGSDAAVVTAVGASGEEVSIRLGDPCTGGYYAAVEGDARVYVVDSGLHDAVDLSLLGLVELPTLTAADESQLQRVELEWGDGVTVYEKTTAAPEEGETEPSYTWSRDGTVVEEDEALSDLVAALRAPSFSSCAAYPGEAEWAQWGLEEAAVITVTAETGSYTLRIGGKTAAGSGYYAALDGVEGIYVLSSSLAASLLGA